MPIEITMPRLSDTMEEGTLINWRVKEGDKVASGDVLADVETDKATMELQAFDDGVVAKLTAGEGDTLAVGDLLVVLAGDGEDVGEAAAAAGSGGAGGSKALGDKQAASGGRDDDGDSATSDTTTAVAAAPSDSGSTSAGDTGAPASSGNGDGEGRIRVSPVARKIAEDRGLDLAGVSGSGPHGRIIKRDVLAALENGGAQAAPQAAPQPAKAGSTPAPVAAQALEARTIKLTNMRKTIAKRLVESKTTIPHFTVTLAIDMDPLMDLRKLINAQLESQGVKLSVNDFITRAAALALVQHPILNAAWRGDTIEVFGTVNMGIAVALPEEKGGGLVVPVIRDAQNKGLRQISQETRALAKKARDSGLSLDEMSDGTFTLSNLGMFGVDHFEAIINPPQAAILAVGGAIEKPVVRDGAIVVGREMTVTLSGDHRVVDGATGAEYLQTLKGLLENPAGLLV